MGKQRIGWSGLTGWPDDTKMGVNMAHYLILSPGNWLTMFTPCSFIKLPLNAKSSIPGMNKDWEQRTRGDIFPYLKTNKCNFNDRTGTWKKCNFSCFYGLAPNNPGVWRIFASFILLYGRKEHSAKFYFSLHFSPLLYGASLAETKRLKRNLLIVDECRVLGSSWHGSPRPRLRTNWKEGKLIMLWEQAALIPKQP